MRYLYESPGTHHSRASPRCTSVLHVMYKRAWLVRLASATATLSGPDACVASRGVTQSIQPCGSTVLRTWIVPVEDKLSLLSVPFGVSHVVPRWPISHRLACPAMARAKGILPGHGTRL